MVRDSKVPYSGLQRREGICGGGVTVPMSLRPHRKVEMVEKHQWFTVVHAPLTVEAGQHCGGAPSAAPTRPHSVVEHPGQSNASTRWRKSR